jgi:hypothetical protein
MELKCLRRIGFRSALLLLPFLVLQLLELFVFPIQFFTFRVWEEALSTPYRYPGAFYPNFHVKKAKEYGDRYRLGDPSQIEAKPVEWFTDSYGYRNRPEIEKQERYDAVVLGDSNIVGGFLDQKDTLTEVMGARSDKSVYSYSYGSDHISLFFNDPRLLQKSPSLLVVESKAGNWSTNKDYLNNFREMPDGSLDVVDRSAEFKSNFYAPTRNPSLEKIESRLTKQAMLNWLKASLASDFTVPVRNTSELFVGRLGLVPSTDGLTWRPFNWIVSGGAVKPLPEEPQPALTIRATGPNSYWHTERFVSSRPDGKIIVRFEAKNSLTPSRHRVWVFEDGSYRSVGEFVATSNWRTFEIPITAKPGSMLEFQLDQADDWQWLSVRDVQVIGAGQPASVTQSPVVIPMSTWMGEGAPCKGTNGDAQDCRQWPIAGKKGYVQTPVLPQPGEGGMLIRFEARADKSSPVFSSIYLFEGPQYRQVAQYAFGSEWREYALLLQPDRSAPIKVQVDFPELVDELAIRNFRATPVDQLR